MKLFTRRETATEATGQHLPGHSRSATLTMEAALECDESQSAALSESTAVKLDRSSVSSARNPPFQFLQRSRFASESECFSQPRKRLWFGAMNDRNFSLRTRPVRKLERRATQGEELVRQNSMPCEPHGIISKAEFAQCRSTRRVFLNVGGLRHEVLWSTLERHSDTRLGKLAYQEFVNIFELCDDFDLQGREFYFDQHTEIFSSVITYHRSGKLHLIGDLCLSEVAESLEYWGLQDSMLEPCCARKLALFRENMLFASLEEDAESSHYSEEKSFGTSRLAKFRNQLWLTLEMPSSSVLAKIWAFLSIAFIVVSTGMLVLGTTEWFQELMDSLYHHMQSTQHNSSSATWHQTANSTGVSNTTSVTGITTEAERADDDDDHPVLGYVELVCIIWFTLEFLIRLLASPDQRRFMTNELNVIDLLSILPYYVALAISGYSESLTSKFTTARKLLQLLRILRILRVFKIARHSTGLQALGYTVKQSYRELGMIVLFLVLGVLFFSTLCYYVEKDAQDSKFTSIPEAFWYTAISMTTVGYGDITPTTPLGKLVGIVCCLCGVLVIALPIPIIVSSFTEYLNRQRRFQRIRST